MSSLYSSVLSAKTGETVPCLINGTALYSRYNPARECESFSQLECFSTAGFYVIGGIGSGIHISAVQNRYPDAFIVAVEPDTETLNYLKEQRLLPVQNEKLILTDIPNLESAITAHYLPALHGNFCLQNLRSWESALHSDQKQQLEQAVSSALKTVSRDYGVQAHFGKLWTRNILHNFNLWTQLAAEKKTLSWQHLCNTLQHKKIHACTILAAGPTLDQALATLDDEKRDASWIICVDTALPALLKRHLIPDMVVSIDPQIASMRHFMKQTESGTGKTILALDLCGTPGAAREWSSSGKPVLFFNENHPLGQYCSQWMNSENPPFLNISAGAGTVTHSAVELAYALGFTSVTIKGADFSFPGNKPYARGTYLEDFWISQCSRTTPLEHQYDTLMYRTDLVTDRQNGNRSTAVLQSYKEALIQRLPELQEQAESRHFQTVTEPSYAADSTTFRQFTAHYLQDLKKNSKNAYFSALPLIAHIKSKGENSDTVIRELIVSSVEKYVR